MNSEPAFDPATMGLLFTALAVLGIVVMILWILLPFAVFGVKKRLDESLRIQREQLLLLGDSLDALRTLAADVTRQVAPTRQERPAASKEKRRTRS